MFELDEQSPASDDNYRNKKSFILKLWFWMKQSWKR